MAVAAGRRRRVGLRYAGLEEDQAGGRLLGRGLGTTRLPGAGPAPTVTEKTLFTAAEMERDLIRERT